MFDDLVELFIRVVFFKHRRYIRLIENVKGSNFS